MDKPSENAESPPGEKELGRATDPDGGCPPGFSLTAPLPTAWQPYLLHRDLFREWAAGTVERNLLRGPADARQRPPLVRSATEIERVPSLRPSPIPERCHHTVRRSRTSGYARSYDSAAQTSTA